jgi:hypothetical protein
MHEGRSKTLQRGAREKKDEVSLARQQVFHRPHAHEGFAIASEKRANARKRRIVHDG